MMCRYTYDIYMEYRYTQIPTERFLGYKNAKQVQTQMISLTYKEETLRAITIDLSVNDYIKQMKDKYGYGQYNRVNI